jgi:hypothetical protein
MKIKSPPGGPSQTDSLQFIIREIVRIADPEKILLLSASYNYQLTETIFIKNPVQDFRESRYDILVLSDGRAKKSLAEQEIMIISRMIRFRNLQLHLMDIHEFNKGVEAGNEFENFILLNAMLSFDKGEIPLSDPVKLKT